MNKIQCTTCSLVLFIVVTYHNTSAVSDKKCHAFEVVMLQAYDQHLNMILGDVEEVVTSVEIDDETYEEIVKVKDTVS